MVLRAIWFARGRAATHSATREARSQPRSSAANPARRIPVRGASSRWRTGGCLLARDPFVDLGEREPSRGDLRSAGEKLGDRFLSEPGDHPALGDEPVRPFQSEPSPPGGLALLHRGQAVARPAFPGDDLAFGRADRLERVGGVLPARCSPRPPLRSPLAPQYDF